MSTRSAEPLCEPSDAQGDSEVRRAQAPPIPPESEDLLRSILSAVPALISYVDREYRYRLVNHTYERWFGRTPESIRGRHVREVLGESAWEIVRPYMERALAGEEVTYQDQLLYRDGSPRTVSVTYTPDRDRAGAVRGFTVLVNDVSAREGAERELRKTREQLQLITDTLPTFVSQCSRDRRFLWVNKSYASHLYLTPEEIAGRPVKDVLGAAAYEVLEPFIARVLEGSPVEFEVEVPYEAIGRRCMHALYTPTFDASGEADGWVAAISDVTRRRELERDRERALEELWDADRQKDEFLAMLAHELRNPLAPILNAVEIMRLRGPTDPLIEAQRELIGRQVHHMKRLLDDLLDVARVSRGKIQLRKELLDLGAVLSQAVEVSRPNITGKDHTLTVDLPQRPLWMEGDATRLLQVFSNLLNNAVKYTDPGGHIRLEVTAEAYDVVVRVRDNGVGMSPELLERAFELFTQADRSLDRAQGGLGIGLTMVRSLVQMHGGTVRAFSDGPGRGSEFMVRLPLAPLSHAPMSVPPSSLTRPETPPLRILIVDDNIDAAESLGALLELTGHEVSIAHDGPAGLAAALASRPDLMLLDIGLPEMDGYEVATRVREAGLDKMVLVALTGYGRDEDIRRSHESGFDHHLVKPVDFPTVEAIVNAIVPQRSPGG